MKDDQSLGQFLKDQVLMAAWTLPNEGSLTDVLRRQAMTNFDDYLKRRKISYADVARQVGSPRGSLIRELVRGQYSDNGRTVRGYRANADDHIRKLNNWVEQHARQQAVKLEGAFVDTAVAVNLFRIGQMIRENQTIGVAVGPTGIGKTRCARVLAEKTTGAIFMTVIFGCYNPRGLIRLLGEALKVRRPLGQGLGHLNQLERVIEALRGSNRLLIFDEAHNFTDEALEVLRQLHDQTECPILLLATKDLRDRVRMSAQPDAGQLHSRFDIMVDLTVKGRGKDSDKRKLFTVEDIRRLYERTPIKLAKDATGYLLDVANLLGWGSLRRCRVLVMNAARRARKRNGLDEDEEVTVTADDLAHADMYLRPGAEDEAVIDERVRNASTAVA